LSVKKEHRAGGEPPTTLVYEGVKIADMERAPYKKRLREFERKKKGDSWPPF